MPSIQANLAPDLMKTNVNSELNVIKLLPWERTLSVSGTATYDQFAIVATDNTVSVAATGVSITASTTVVEQFVFTEIQR